MSMQPSDPIRCARDGAQPTASALMASLSNFVRPPQPLDREYAAEIERWAPGVGVDPGFVYAQWWHETGAGQSPRWHRDHNPAGIGIPAASSTQPTPIANGVEAARCHLVALCIVLDRTFPDSSLVAAPPATQSFFNGMLRIALSPGRPNVARISDLNKPFRDATGELQFTWAEDQAYATELTNRGNEIFSGIGNPTGTTGPSFTPAPWTAAIVSHGATLRDQPSKDGTVLVRFNRGDTVLLTGRNTRGYLTAETNGQSGWVHNRHLVTTAAREIGLRSTSLFVDDDSNIAQTVSAGTTVDLDGQCRIGFVEINFGADTGWVYSQYLRVNGKRFRDVTPGMQATAGGLGGDNLNVRDAPLLTGSNVIGSVKTGESVTLTGKFKPGFASVHWVDRSLWVFTENITGRHDVASATLKLEEEMHKANMHVSQGPFESFSHSICDCYDFAIVQGTPIYPIAGGKVLRAETPAAGTDDFTYSPHFVDVETEFGVIRYAHLSQLLVNAGDIVTTDTKLGLSGTKGTGAHLHLQLNGGATGPTSHGMTLTQILDTIHFDLADFPRSE